MVSFIFSFYCSRIKSVKWQIPTTLGTQFFSIHFIFRLVFVTNTLPYQLASFTFTICVPIFPAMSQRLLLHLANEHNLFGDGLIYVHWFRSISNIFLSQIIWRSVIFEINLIPSNVRHLDKAT